MKLAGTSLCLAVPFEDRTENSDHVERECCFLADPGGMNHAKQLWLSIDTPCTPSRVEPAVHGAHSLPADEKKSMDCRAVVRFPRLDYFATSCCHNRLYKSREENRFVQLRLMKGSFFKGPLSSQPREQRPIYLLGNCANIRCYAI